MGVSRSAASAPPINPPRCAKLSTNGLRKPVSNCQMAQAASTKPMRLSRTKNRCWFRYNITTTAASTPKTAPEAPTDGPGLASRLRAEPATAPEVHEHHPGHAERVLARHADDVEDHHVAEEMPEAAVKKRGGDRPPPLAGQHLGTHQRPGFEEIRSGDPRLDQRLGIHEHARRDLPGEHGDVRHDEREHDGREMPHAALEIDPAVGARRRSGPGRRGRPLRNHVRRDENRLFAGPSRPAVGQRRSPVSSITPNATAMRRSMSRCESAVMSST